jgi:hypothetical protein
MGLLGLNRLRNLVTMLILANDDPCNMLLLPQALTRAAMCSRLAARDCQDNKEPAFMVGLLSMIDVLLGLKLEVLCEQLPLASSVRQALLAHEGPLGKTLHLVKAFEKSRLTNASAEAVATLNQYFLESRICGQSDSGWDGQLIAINARRFLVGVQKRKIHHSRRRAVHPRKFAARYEQACRFSGQYLPW